MSISSIQTDLLIQCNPSQNTKRFRGEGRYLDKLLLKYIYGNVKTKKSQETLEAKLSKLICSIRYGRLNSFIYNTTVIKIVAQ